MRVHQLLSTFLLRSSDAEPSREAVAAAHVRFVEEMKALFERHKKGAGFPDLQLVVL